MPSQRENGTCSECQMAGLPALKAAAMGHLKCLTAAFKYDKKRSCACDGKGATALHLAARGGRVECLKWLLAKSGISPAVPAKNGETPSHLAAAAGNLGCLQLLLSYDKEASDRKDRYSQTPLHLAVLRSRARCVKWLLDVGRASPLAATQSGGTALHFASAVGHLDILRQVVAAIPADAINVKDLNGTTAVYYAAQEGHLDVLVELVSVRGADALARCHDGMNSLHAASQGGNSHVVQWLHKWLHESRLTDRTKDGATVVHFAAAMGHEECLQWLLSTPQGGDMLDAVDVSLATPLHDAAEHGHLGCLKLLLRFGANSAMKDEDNLTAYDLAFRNEHDECAALLQQRTSSLEVQRKQNRCIHPQREKLSQESQHTGKPVWTSDSSSQHQHTKQLFNPKYSSSDLMQTLTERISTASSMRDVSELDEFLTVNIQDSDTPRSNMQILNTGHVVPALREQLHAMGVLTEQLELLQVTESGLPPAASSSWQTENRRGSVDENQKSAASNTAKDKHLKESGKNSLQTDPEAESSVFADVSESTPVVRRRQLSLPELKLSPYATGNEDYTPHVSPQQGVNVHTPTEDEQLSFGSSPISPTPSLSTRFSFIEGSGDIPTPGMTILYDSRGIPIPPAAPTAESLKRGIVNLETAQVHEIPKWARRYRRGWLARAIGEQTSPDDELQIVLAVRRRQIEMFDSLIAKQAAFLKTPDAKSKVGCK